MAEVRIFETEQFQKDLEHISISGLDRLIDKLNRYVYPQLRSRPAVGPNIKRLKGAYSGVWRYRIGAWRFFYTIDEERRIVAMVAASHRSKSY